MPQSTGESTSTSGTQSVRLSAGCGAGKWDGAGESGLAGSTPVMIAFGVMDSLRLSQIAGRFAGQRILVAGDLMLDEFLWGQVSRISPEAPVPVVEVTSESY